MFSGINVVQEKTITGSGTEVAYGKARCHFSGSGNQECRGWRQVDQLMSRFSVNSRCQCFCKSELMKSKQCELIVVKASYSNGFSPEPEIVTVIMQSRLQKRCRKIKWKVDPLLPSNGVLYDDHCVPGAYDAAQI